MAGGRPRSDPSQVVCANQVVHAVLPGCALCPQAMKVKSKLGERDHALLGQPMLCLLVAGLGRRQEAVEAVKAERVSQFGRGFNAGETCPTYSRR